MKLMAFVGSPRKGSNIDTLIDKVIEGAQSKIDVEAEKIHLYDANIKNCTGCLACTAFRGGQECPLQDDMAGILQRMIKADFLIFGSPNHVHSMSAALTNLFCRMQPLIKMQAIKDESGKILSATATTLVSGKKAVMVASQGDFSPSASALLLRALDSNLKDFRLKKVAEVFSTGNLEKANVKNKEADLQQAFEAGVKLVIL